MSENNKTDNLQADSVADENLAAQETQQDTSDEVKAETDKAPAEETGSVFGKGSENALGGAEYVGNFDDLLKSLGITPISQMEAGDFTEEDYSEEIKLNIKQEDGYVPFSDETYLQSAQKEASATNRRR